MELSCSDVTNLVCWVQCILQIHTSQNGENVGLNAGHQNFETIDGGDRQNGHGADGCDGSKTCENFDNCVAGHDVTRKTDRVANRAHEVRDKLDHRDDRAQDNGASFIQNRPRNEGRSAQSQGS